MMAKSDGAIIIGTSMNEKRIFLPYKVASKRSARKNPIINSRIVVSTAKRIVKFKADQNVGSWMRFLKLPKPAGVMLGLERISFENEVLIPK